MRRIVTMEFLDTVDTLVLGRVMYHDYEAYWLAVLENPTGVLPLTGRRPTDHEIAYARWADQIPHVVVSKTLSTVRW